MTLKIESMNSKLNLQKEEICSLKSTLQDGIEAMRSKYQMQSKITELMQQNNQVVTKIVMKNEKIEEQKTKIASLNSNNKNLVR